MILDERRQTKHAAIIAIEKGILISKFVQTSLAAAFIRTILVRRFSWASAEGELTTERGKLGLKEV
jgi:hypothetical protein